MVRRDRIFEHQRPLAKGEISHIASRGTEPHDGSPIRKPQRTETPGTGSNDEDVSLQHVGTLPPHVTFVVGRLPVDRLHCHTAPLCIVNDRAVQTVQRIHHLRVLLRPLWKSFIPEVHHSKLSVAAGHDLASRGCRGPPRAQAVRSQNALSEKTEGSQACRSSFQSIVMIHSAEAPRTNNQMIEARPRARSLDVRFVERTLQ
mmetsp:Transcript_50550/g.99459  ORF Transcript_50550/g.99459 Transcript_50550/m.99459 type:complete len:202 (-) Transcript_50550:248-853(-)